jgi:AraC-like DNA-binding protein
MYNCTRIEPPCHSTEEQVTRRKASGSPDPAAWNIERLTIDCTETSPVEVEAFTYNNVELSQFDMHYCLELGVVLEGSTERYYLTGERSYQAGEIWLCGMWEPHGWGVHATPCRVAVFFLHPPLLANTRFSEADGINWMAPFSASPLDRPVVSPGRRADVIRHAQEVLSFPASAPGIQKVERHLKVLEILLILIDGWQSPSLPRVWSGQDLDAVGRAMQLALQAQGLVTTQEAARVCGMNRNALSRLFLDYMGISFAEFALRSRVSGAAAQLKEGKDPLKAVARQWGFTDASHFHRSFLRYYGCSPSEYREQAALAHH